MIIYENGRVNDQNLIRAAKFVAEMNPLAFGSDRNAEMKAELSLRRSLSSLINNSSADCLATAGYRLGYYFNDVEITFQGRMVIEHFEKVSN